MEYFFEGLPNFSLGLGELSESCTNMTCDILDDLCNWNCVGMTCGKYTCMAKIMDPY